MWGSQDYNYFRYYDPSTGRYLSSDPIGLGGGLNTYLYANANSVRYTDPLGLFTGVLPAPAAPPVGATGSPDGAGRERAPRNFKQLGRELRDLLFNEDGNDPADSPIAPPAEEPKQCNDDKKCWFERQVYYGGPEKTCVYKQKGAFGIITIRQWAGKPCPPIDPNTCWVDTRGTPEEGNKPPKFPY